MSNDKIDTAARAYVEAATTLADALLEKLQAEAPDIAAKAAQALQCGERMQLAMEVSDSPASPSAIPSAIPPRR